MKTDPPDLSPPASINPSPALLIFLGMAAALFGFMSLFADHRMPRYQHRVAAVAGVLAFVVLSVPVILVDFPDRPNPEPADATTQLGQELLGDSMLVFQTAGVALLATMIGAVVLASRSGRYGVAEEGSAEPPLDPDIEAAS